MTEPEYTTEMVNDYHRDKLKSVGMDTLKAWIKEIRDSKTTDVRIRELAIEFHERFLIMSLPINHLDLFRACNWNETDELPTHVNRLLAPPPELTNRNRCNLKGKPVLYLADQPSLAIHEIKVPVGGTFIALQLTTKPNAEDLYSMVYGKNAFVMFNYDERISKGKKWYKKLCGVYYKKAMFIRKLIDDEFIRDNDLSGLTYRFTANLVDYSFSLDPKLDGIFYPSIAVNGKSHNIVFKNDAWQKRYEPKRVGFYKLEERGHITLLSGGSVLSNGDLKWGMNDGVKNPLPSDLAKQKQIQRDLYGYESDI